MVGRQLKQTMKEFAVMSLTVEDGIATAKGSNHCTGGRKDYRSQDFSSRFCQIFKQQLYQDGCLVVSNMKQIPSKVCGCAYGARMM